MSSTKRGGQRDISDYYVTPLWAIRQFLSAWPGDGIDPLTARVLDPCAGGDADNPMSYPTVLREFGFGQATDAAPGTIETIDIRDDSLADIRQDYLTLPAETGEPFPGYDLIITNPPFALAAEIIAKAHEQVRRPDPNAAHDKDTSPYGGYIVMLLRLNFLGGLNRSDFWREYPPNEIWVHPRRMSFSSDGKTDSIEYAHFVWRPSDPAPAAQTHVGPAHIYRLVDDPAARGISVDRVRRQVKGARVL